MDFSKYRKQFPILSNYAYLNTARYCALPASVITAQKKFLDHVATEGSWKFDHWNDLYDKTREKVARLIGSETKNICFLPNVSLGFNLAAKYLPTRRVLCLSGDFLSVKIAWEPHGYEVKYLDHTREGFPDELEKELAIENQIISFSWIQSTDGFEVEPEYLFQKCKQFNHILVLDGTQGLGALPFSVDREVNCMFLSSGFKWLLAGYGVAVCYISDDLLPIFKPIRGWNNRGTEEMGARTLEVGNSTYLNVAGLSKGLDLLNEIGIDKIEAYNSLIKTYLTDRLATRKVKFTSSRSSITTFEATEEEYNKLAAEDIQVTLQSGFIRVSPNFYNNKEDVDRLLEILSNHGLKAPFTDHVIRE